MVAQRIVCKFGGTSMATAESIRQVAAILMADPRRSICVVSAPGRIENGKKVTDLLYAGELHAAFRRFARIIEELRLSSKVGEHLAQEFKSRAKSPHMPTRLSFGEHMSAYVLAEFLGWHFMDATEVIQFWGRSVRAQLPRELPPVVIPGFYGLDCRRWEIATFPRGGSDITGAYVASACRAELYENWTDVSGVYDADPRFVPQARPFASLSYEDLATITYGGAQVLHPDAIRPVAESGIPIHIRNTFAPGHSGTIVGQPSS